MNLFKYYILSICVFCVVSAYSQTEVNVLTKRISKNFQVNPKDKIEINAIKANIRVLAQNRNDIKIEAKLISKNKDIEQARKEMEYIKCSITKSNRTVSLGNIFILPEKTSNVTSILQVVYTIYTPDNIDLIINNKYGNVNISGMHSELEMDLEYGEIMLENISGTGKIDSKFTTIKANILDGEYEFISENSQFKLVNIEGSCTIKNTTGDIYLTPGLQLKNLSVRASFSNVVIKAKGFNDYNYNLNTKYAVIHLPEDQLMKKYIIKKTDTRFEYTSNALNPAIFVETSFKDIKFEL